MLNCCVERKSIKTDRLQVSYLTAGNPNNEILMLIHGNVSSSVFYDETIKHFCKDFWVIAPDLRGYGETEALPIDATRGTKDWSDDLNSFVRALNIKTKINLLGWSLGGGVVMQYAIDHTDSLASLILIAPVSPYGFGGSKGIKGTVCSESFAGSGGGTANPQFVEALKSKDTSANDANSPRNVMNQFYFKPPFTVNKEREDAFVDSMNATVVDNGFYPGDFEPTSDWPGVAPGGKGVNNTLSPKYLNLTAIKDLNPKVPILWVRGSHDLIVSDTSFFDFGFLGKMGYVPNWPGDEVFPAQPMVSQTRDVLEQYVANGGSYKELIIEDAGHSPHIEKPQEFNKSLISFIQQKSL